MQFLYTKNNKKPFQRTLFNGVFLTSLACFFKTANDSLLIFLSLTIRKNFG